MQDPDTGLAKWMPNDQGLYQAMQLAGASYGIVTEFQYNIKTETETVPVVVFLFIENEEDLKSLEKAMSDGSFQITLVVGYSFKPMTFSYKMLVSQ